MNTPPPKLRNVQNNGIKKNATQKKTKKKGITEWYVLAIEAAIVVLLVGWVLYQ